MKVLKWFCFILVCLDTIAYVSHQLSRERTNSASRMIGRVIGLITGILARIYVLYGTATCWLLA